MKIIKVRSSLSLFFGYMIQGLEGQKLKDEVFNDLYHTRRDRIAFALEFKKPSTAEAFAVDNRSAPTQEYVDRLKSAMDEDDAILELIAAIYFTSNQPEWIRCGFLPLMISEEEVNNLPTKAKNYALKRVFEGVKGGGFNILVGIS